MMQINKTEYFCDRCGQAIPENKAHCFVKSDYTNFIVCKPVRIKILRYEWENAILCDTCKKSFGTWWKAGEGV